MTSCISFLVGEGDLQSVQLVVEREVGIIHDG